MPFIPVSGVAQVAMNFLSDVGVRAQNRYFVLAVDHTTPAGLTTIASVFGDWFSESLAPCIAANWSLNNIIARDMSAEEGAEVTYTADLPAPGTAAGLAHPNQVSATITWSTGFVGRSKRGRTYLLGVPAAFATDHVSLTTSGQAAYQAAADSLLALLNAAEMSLAVVSFYTGGAPRPAGAVTEVIAGQARKPLATQRRRLR